MSSTDGKAGYIIGYEDGKAEAKRDCICDSLRGVLRDRDRELLEIKGPCSNKTCGLHCAHSGPCRVDAARPEGDTDDTT